MTFLSKPEFGTAASKLRARYLADNCYELIEELVEVRKRRDMSQAEVGKLLGISQQAVSKIEAMDGNPHLSTVRQYAHAVGALFKFTVDADEGQLEEHGNEWVKVTFPTRRRLQSPDQSSCSDVSFSFSVNAHKDITSSPARDSKRSDFAAAA